MRYSSTFIPTVRETPSGAEVQSHILMLRAGLIRKAGSGLYHYLPLGLRVLHKISQIIREEMDASGALEIQLSFVTPAELWKESARYDQMGPELLRFLDRNHVEMVLGPTYEESFVALLRENLQSYKALPMTLYQIHTKFRDEIRPRYGVLRSREFLMKDAYSFDVDEAGLDQSYQKMRVAYTRIFERCGIPATPVLAYTGNMGGSVSEEFMVPSPVGEELIVQCPQCGYTANQEQAYAADLPHAASSTSLPPLQKIHTPNTRRMDDLCTFFDCTPDTLIKAVLYQYDNQPLMVLIRGDYEINEVKLKTYLDAQTLELMPAEQVSQHTQAAPGFAGPVGTSLPLLVDLSVFSLAEAVVGANETDYHYQGFVPHRDLPPDTPGVDLRLVKAGDPCPHCQSPLSVYPGIEVGHIFKLGTKYTQAMQFHVLDPHGEKLYPIMGCYGIGVARIMACIIEQSADTQGMVWPMSIAPYHVILVVANPDPACAQAAEALYQRFHQDSPAVEVLLDDRDERAGLKFKDADLLGIPIRVTFGRGFAAGLAEVHRRKDQSNQQVPIDQVWNHICQLVSQETQLSSRRNP